MQAQLVSSSGYNLENILRNLVQNDLDLIGENGKEYLWEEAAEEGYKNNLEWLLNIIKIEDTAEAQIKKFFDTWVQRDGYYLDSDVIIDSVETLQGTYYFVAIQYITD